MSELSRWQREYHGLPDWARELVDALKPCTSYGVSFEDGGGISVTISFSENEASWRMLDAVADAKNFAGALSAPFPPPTAPAREKRVFNIVEAIAEGEGDCAFDQPCCFGHRVEDHAVYCHNEGWPDAPTKCRRNRDDYRHEDCPGFVANPESFPKETAEHIVISAARDGTEST